MSQIYRNTLLAALTAQVAVQREVIDDLPELVGVVRAYGSDGEQMVLDEMLTKVAALEAHRKDMK